jgi:hypothetical protein
MKGFFNPRKFREETKDLKDFPSPSIKGKIELEVSNFIDGKRSILGIRSAVSAEFVPIPHCEEKRYIEVLQNLGYVRIEIIE